MIGTYRTCPECHRSAPWVVSIYRDGPPRMECYCNGCQHRWSEALGDQPLECAA